MLIKNYKIFLFLVISTVIATTKCYADQDLISLFPLNKYDQTISKWIKPSDKNYDKSLLNTEMQKKHLEVFFNHYFGSSSPWNPGYVTKILRQLPPNDLKTVEQNIIAEFSNNGKPDNQINYGTNFRPYPQDWIDGISNNMDINQFDGLTYQDAKRAIATDNLHARALPTDDPSFYSYKLAGQGYPFDNLQMSAIWAGTPLYVLAETKDHAWSLVITPDFIAWAKTTGIAHVTDSFVDNWETDARQHLVAITKSDTSILDENGQYLFSAFIGSVFPAEQTPTGLKMMAPVMDANHFAVVKTVILPPDQAAFLPLSATPHNFAVLMNSMIGRTYGWGSMYFYNDCSAELKSLLAPFGIYLPRHSSHQITAGNMVDMSAATPEKKIAYLKENGHPFLTIIYIGGHVVLYVGNHPNPDTQDLMAMTYQNVWGLSPNPPTRRAIIGKSVLFPMLAQYPEDTSLTSLAEKKYFQVSYLDQLPDRWFKSGIIINLRSMMFPDRFDK